MSDDDYHQGLRDGRLASLEKTVEKLVVEIDMIRKALWMLYGAIALVGILPKIYELLSNAVT